MKVLLYSDDINLILYWQESLLEESLVLDEIEELIDLKNSVIILNYSALGSNAKNLIEAMSQNSNLVMVLHRNPDIATAKQLLSFGAKAYGNALMRDHFINSAIETIKEGLVWLHPEFTSELINQLPQTKDKDNTLTLEKLSDREKEVAILLKDGDTYKNIAQKLEITPRTIKAHAQSIYTKLQVKDRLALALLLK
ncbi:MAG: LuxR C-terminal-related transcriptional regulator [Sulfurimonas sp.]|uniref:response regulator transcription factor n=1 Tax=Sulfurimonas sp. TaxID=2022749 RepID=UPI0025F8B898|nr:LuxR C-terminal-related transcriptional regulator [Sulfurimonas sp.]MCK9491465.1 LuxR C-terminal-related transcriptional regulator [Sulfurimonas sp.]